MLTISKKFIIFLRLFVLILIINAEIQAKNQSLIRTFIDKNGDLIDEVIIPGSPPPDYRMPIAEIPDPKTNRNVVILDDVPAFDWCYGCFPTSGAMIAGYYDRTGYANVYTGPTNNGYMPLDNNSWGQTWWVNMWVDECPLSVTHLGIDGRVIRGHVDDYWIQYNNPGPDPYIVNGWPEHILGECTGDYMGTSQWNNWNNIDGATVLAFSLDGTPLYDYTGCEPGHRDGCHGFKLFFESRNYDVSLNYSQYIYGYNGNTLGFTFDQYKNEIDNGYPLFIYIRNPADSSSHIMVGFGYNDATNEIYIHDTWDCNNHSMTWGGNYHNMQHAGVSVLHLDTINEEDILTAFYNCLNGDNWTTNTFWLSSYPLNLWYGLTVSNGHVIEINLEWNNLTGVLPNEIGNYAYLEKLDLQKNAITGTIPSTIGNLSELIWLDLSENQFNGQIPSTIGNLSNLEKLYLHENQFSGAIPNEIGNLSSLTDMFLYYNQFYSIPGSIGNLTNAEWIDMRHNQISSPIPAQIGNCANLEALDLSYNYISDPIPTTIGNLNNLGCLDISNNWLTGSIPNTIGNLNNLTRLNLTHNFLTGTIPSEIGNLSNLAHLFLEENQLTGSIPNEVGNCGSLVGIYLIDNGLTGPIPNSIGNLTNLHWLYLNNNQLTGPIPTEIGNVASMWQMDLSHNKLSGAVPIEINNLTLMWEMRLNDNEIEDLPDMSPIIVNIIPFPVQNNKLTFEDLEPNAVYYWFEYSPQDSVWEKLDTLVSAGSSVILESTVGGQHNLYQWFFNGSKILGAIDSTLVIDSVLVEDQGVYTCDITNTIATELTLHRRPISLTVETGVDPNSNNEYTTKLKNYPNPFKQTTNISFNTPVRRNVILQIYNVKGCLVKKFEILSEVGENSLIWDGSDEKNKELPSGIYLYKLDCEKGNNIYRKMVLIR